MHFNWRVIKTFAFRTAPRHQLSPSQTGSTVTRQIHLKTAQSDEFQNTIFLWKINFMNSRCFGAKRLTPRIRAHGPWRWHRQGEPSPKMPLCLPEESSTPDSPHWVCAQGQVCSWDLPGGALHNLHPDTSWQTGQGNCSDRFQLLDAFCSSLQGTAFELHFPGAGQGFSAWDLEGCREWPSSYMTPSKLQKKKKKSLEPQFLDLQLEAGQECLPCEAVLRVKDEIQVQCRRCWHLVRNRTTYGLHIDITL